MSKYLFDVAWPSLPKAKPLNRLRLYINSESIYFNIKIGYTDLSSRSSGIRLKRSGVRADSADKVNS